MTGLNNYLAGTGNASPANKAPAIGIVGGQDTTGTAGGTGVGTPNLGNTAGNPRRTTGRRYPIHRQCANFGWFPQQSRRHDDEAPMGHLQLNWLLDSGCQRRNAFGYPCLHYGRQRFGRYDLCGPLGISAQLLTGTLSTVGGFLYLTQISEASVPADDGGQGNSDPGNVGGFSPSLSGRIVADLAEGVVPEPATYLAGLLVFAPLAASTFRRFRGNRQDA